MTGLDRLSQLAHGGSTSVGVGSQIVAIVVGTLFPGETPVERCQLEDVRMLDGQTEWTAWSDHLETVGV